MRQTGCYCGLFRSQVDLCVAMSRVKTHVSQPRSNYVHIDTLLQQGRQQTDAIKRQQLYLQIEQKLMDQALVVPLVDQLSVFALRPGVSGLKFSGSSYPLITDMSTK